MNYRYEIDEYDHLKYKAFISNNTHVDVVINVLYYNHCTSVIYP